jgi:hypothetical protein
LTNYRDFQGGNKVILDIIPENLYNRAHCDPKQKEKDRRKFMRKQISKMMLFACLCFIVAFGFSSKDLHAADISSNVKKVAFIDANDNLVLRFASFSTAGYSWAVTGNGATINGSLAGTDTLAQISIKGIYGNKQIYALTLTANDTKDFITVNYYTGAGIKGSKLTQKKTNISASWSLNQNRVRNDYSGYSIEIANGSGNLEKYQERGINSGSTTSTTIKGTGVPSGKHSAYVIGMKNGNYGYGEAKNFSYAAKPAKVTGLNLTPGAEKVTVAWTASKNATGYAVYMKKPGASKYKLAKKVSGTSYTAKGLKKKKVYSFKVKAYAKAGKITMEAPFSVAKSVKVVAAPDPIKKMVYITDRAGTVLGIQWPESDGAKTYQVTMRESGKGAYADMGESKQTYMSFRHYDPKKTYDVIVYAKNGSRTSKPSPKMTVCPEKYLKEHRDELLAKKVRTIRYLKNHKCEYVKANYSDETKVAYVNYKGFSSKTGYLIWANLYTQQATIFKGKKGNWKILRAFDIASGAWDNRTKRGTHKITFKEFQWLHPGSKTMYVSHFYKKSSFHCRPKTRSGRLYDKRIKQPVSKACIRCPDKDAIFIYKHIPKGTTVRVW